MRILFRIVNKLQRKGLSWYYRALALRNGSWISLGASLDVMPGGKLSIGRGVRVLTGSHLSIYENARLHIGDRVWIGPFNIIYCAKSIQIGVGSRVSHFCSIIDHNYTFQTGGDYFSLPKRSSPIEIGAYNWLGAGATLLKGVITGDNCVIGANTLLRARYIPSGSICAQKDDFDALKVALPNVN